MEPLRFQGWVLEHPDQILALLLSHPHEPVDRQVKRHTSIDILDDEVKVSVRRPPPAVAAGPIVFSKEAIGWALLLLDAWREQASEAADWELSSALAQFSRSYGTGLGQSGRLHRPTSMHGLRELASHLGIREVEPSAIDERVSDVLASLEQKGWIVDPVVTMSGMLIFAVGLIPMQMSVRTDEGERLARQIHLTAPLWSFYLREEAGEDHYREWAFNLRGIHVVRKMLELAAREFIRGEEESREQNGYLNLDRRADPRLDPPADPDQP